MYVNFLKCQFQNVPIAKFSFNSDVRYKSKVEFFFCLVIYDFFLEMLMLYQFIK